MQLEPLESGEVRVEEEGEEGRMIDLFFEVYNAGGKYFVFSFLFIRWLLPYYILAMWSIALIAFVIDFRTYNTWKEDYKLADYAVFIVLYPLFIFARMLFYFIDFRVN